MLCLDLILILSIFFTVCGFHHGPSALRAESKGHSKSRHVLMAADFNNENDINDGTSVPFSVLLF